MTVPGWCKGCSFGSLGLLVAIALYSVIGLLVLGVWGCAETLPYCSGSECGGAGGAVELDGAAGVQ